MPFKFSALPDQDYNSISFMLQKKKWKGKSTDTNFAVFRDIKWTYFNEAWLREIVTCTKPLHPYPNIMVFSLCFSDSLHFLIPSETLKQLLVIISSLRFNVFQNTTVSFLDGQEAFRVSSPLFMGNSSKTPCGCPKSRMVPNPIYMFFSDRNVYLCFNIYILYTICLRIINNKFN